MKGCVVAVLDKLTESIFTKTKDNTIDTFTSMGHDTMVKSSCSYC